MELIMDTTLSSMWSSTVSSVRQENSPPCEWGKNESGSWHCMARPAVTHDLCGGSMKIACSMGFEVEVVEVVVGLAAE